MALTTTITPTHIAVALGQDAPASGSPTEAQWEMWISDALMLIQARVTELGAVEADISDAALDYVIREAVVAQVKRPDDLKQVTVSVDDASTSKSYSTSAGRVRILEDWWALLGLTPAGGQAYSVDTSPTCGSHLPWCSLSLGALYCSCGADIAGYPIYEGGECW